MENSVDWVFVFMFIRLFLAVFLTIPHFLAWAWLAKPKAKVFMPNFQPLPKHLRKNPRKSAKYRIPLRRRRRGRRRKKKKKNPLKIKIHEYFFLTIIFRFKFIINFDRCAMLVVRNCLTKNFEL